MTTQLHPSQSTDTPDLRIIALDMIVEHEYNDAQRTAPLAVRLEAEGLLKNPPIVTPMGEGDDRFVVLDGANRTTALMHLNYPHILAQVVRYEAPYVALSTWHHVVTGIDLSKFTRALAGVTGLEFLPTTLTRARAGLASREYFAYAIRADAQTLAVRPDAPRRSIHERNQLLNALVDTYKDEGKLFRAMTDNLDEALNRYQDLTGLVIFPNYDFAEVLTLARDGELLPTGLTRHLIQGRALRTNYPLSELKSSDSLEDKNARLQDWLKKKLSSKEMRFYGESTYLFDE